MNPIRHAPAHLVRQLQYTCPPPPTPPHHPAFDRDPKEWADHWNGQLRAIADQIWTEAWYAGAAYGQEIATAPRLFVVDQAEMQSLRQRLARNSRPPINLGGFPPTAEPS